MTLVLSSFLSYHSTTAPAESPSTWIVAKISIVLRRLGKIIASVNAIWIVATCMLQFSNFYDRCYCNSSVFGRGAKAYNVITLTPDDIAPMKQAWSGGVFLAAGSTIICVAFVNLFINPDLPD
jgi:hypothetical protein